MTDTHFFLSCSKKTWHFQGADIGVSKPGLSFLLYILMSFFIFQNVDKVVLLLLQHQPLAEGRATVSFIDIVIPIILVRP